ncbi:hypothetical protein [Holospora curviuscula]|uniref:Uncharacterized protein n=1 Tax=Holospora curviuscula TaxID=1082868 RepID=A0A2S5RA65_9PROT|nr:hypothetical protein [Holospora curviuscula]PPE04219.1 hypothetical protein HCUR_00410 [Holospora curviuscula]
MGPTLREVRLRTGSVEVLTCWVEEMVLTNIPETLVLSWIILLFHKGKAMQKMIKNAGHTLL